MKLDYNFGKLYTPIIVKKFKALVKDILTRYGSLSVVDLHEIMESAVYQSVYAPHLQQIMMARYEEGRPVLTYKDNKYGWIDDNLHINLVKKNLCECGRFWIYEIEVNEPVIIDLS